MQDAAGTKNRKSDLYVPRYTKMNRVCTKLYLEKRMLYRDIPRYTEISHAVVSMVYLGICFQVGPNDIPDVLGTSRDILFDLKLYRDIA